MQFNTLEVAVLRAAEKLHAECKSAGMEDMRIQVTVSTDHSGDLVIKYAMAKGRYDTDVCSGNSLGPVVVEFFRRVGWNIANNAKQITDRLFDEAARERSNDLSKNL